jgi:hypothetical protein
VKWATLSGQLPDGLKMDETGKIEGTPTVATAAKPATITVQCEVSDKIKPSKTLSVTIKSAG